MTEIAALGNAVLRGKEITREEQIYLIVHITRMTS